MPLRSSSTLTASFLLSVSVHALLLFLAAVIVTAPRAGERQLIRISLLQPGGGKGGRDSPAPPAVRAAAKDSMARATKEAVRPPARKIRKSATGRKPVVKKMEAAPRQEAVSASAAEVSAGTAVSHGNGEGVGSGTGTGTGTGTGEGTGAGTGAGTGKGAGNGLQAHCLYCPEPTYPRMARLRGWEGTADVEVVVARDGSVCEAQISRSSGHAVLDDAAVSVARKSRFELPGTDGDAVRGVIAYGFRLRN